MTYPVDPVDTTAPVTPAQARGAMASGATAFDLAVMRGEHPPEFVSDPICVISLGRVPEGGLGNA